MGVFENSPYPQSPKKLLACGKRFGRGLTPYPPLLKKTTPYLSIRRKSLSPEPVPEALRLLFLFVLYSPS